MTFNSFYSKTISLALFLVPVLLLTTENFSVAVVVITILASIGYLIASRKQITLNRFDLIIIFCFACYFFGAIPVTIMDGTTARYFQGGYRLLLCIPVYLALSHYLKHGLKHGLKPGIQSVNLPLREYLEWGIIIGSIGALALAVYQFFVLNMPRVDGFLYSINFGYLACSLAFLAFTFSLNSKRKLFLSIAFLLNLASVMMTLTRGAMFAIPLLLCVCVVLSIKNISFKNICIGAVLLVLGSTLAYNNSSSVKQRIDYTIYEFSNIATGNINKAVSSGDRLQYWMAATEAFKASPLIGLPYAQREQLNHELYLAGEMDKRASQVSRGHAHSQYFEMLASNGILGIISIFAIFAVPFGLFTQHFLKYQSDWAYSGAIFVAGFAIFSLTEVPLTANLIGSFYGFMLAVFFASISAEKFHHHLTTGNA